MKKKFIVTAATLVTLIACSLPVFAKTVYYNGTKVNWEYGRKWVLWSFSEVQSSVYEHCATANSDCSGWKRATVLASASDCIGNATACCYWNCR